MLDLDPVGTKKRWRCKPSTVYPAGAVMIRALIFDFDGTILDTEKPAFLGWQKIYEDHNHVLTFEEYSLVVGTDYQKFNPRVNLEHKLGKKLDWVELDARRRNYDMRLIEANDVLPGVEQLLREARSKGLPCAVASSSNQEWVRGHLQRLELLEHFAFLSCADEGRRPKPTPDVYFHALQRLQLSAKEVVAIEDSPNGLAAAQAVGIRCVVVPNEITARLQFPFGHRWLPSLDGVCLETLHLHSNG